MIVTKKETVTETKKVTVGHKCDICKKLHEGRNYPNSWHYFSHGHQDWGNDSIDSIEWFLVCSPECYFKQLKKSFRELNGYYGAKIDDIQVDFIKELLNYIKGLMPK